MGNAYLSYFSPSACNGAGTLGLAFQCLLMRYPYNDLLLFNVHIFLCFPERGGDTDVSQCYSHDEKQKSK